MKQQRSAETVGDIRQTARKRADELRALPRSQLAAQLRVVSERIRSQVYDRPQEEAVKIGVSYTSCVYERRPEHVPGVNALEARAPGECLAKGELATPVESKAALQETVAFLVNCLLTPRNLGASPHLSGHIQIWTQTGQKPIDAPAYICYNTRNRLRNRFRNRLQQNRLWITSKMRAMDGPAPA